MGSPFAAPFITEGRPASFGGKTAYMSRKSWVRKPYKGRFFPT
jgi:hypothetical protein